MSASGGADEEWIEHRKRIASMRQSRLAAAMLGALAADIAVHPRPGQRQSSSTAWLVLDSLRRNNRLVMNDVQDGLHEWATLHPDTDANRPVDALARMVPLVAWMRGNRTRISNAACALSCAPENDVASMFVCVMYADWLRELFRVPDPAKAWALAVDNQAAIINRDWVTEPVWNAVTEGPQPGARPHPAIETLWEIRACIARSGDDCAEALERARASNIEGLIVPTAAVAGLIHGQDAVLAALGVKSEEVTDWMPAIEAIKHRAESMYRLERTPDITSQTHPLPIIGIQTADAVLGVSEFPGESRSYWSDGSRICRDLHSDLQRLRDWGTTEVVSLLPTDTIIDNNIGGLAFDADAIGMAILHFPVVSETRKTLGWKKSEWTDHVGQVVRLLRQGRRPVVHCHSWNDATCRFVARVLHEAGVENSDAIVIDAVRKLADMLAVYDIDEL